MTETNSLLLPRRNEHPDFGSGSIFFVGNATVLIRYAGFTILTDPNFLHACDHVHLGYGLSSKRTTNPAVEIEDLPPLTHKLCKSTASFLATATIARFLAFLPPREAIFSP